MQKQAKARRRARKKGSSRIERVSPLKVFERDGWRCGICGKLTLRTQRGKMHPRAPELDHIVTLADGGDHTYANTQCACRKCNGLKGAKTYGQLHLFPAG
jgi:5-methylcytosine-specific restriction endonuclease McrA